MPGAWEDADGCPHIDVLALHDHLRARGFPIQDTPEEIADTRRTLARMLREKGMPVIERESAAD